MLFRNDKKDPEATAGGNKGAVAAVAGYYRFPAHGRAAICRAPALDQGP